MHIVPTNPSPATSKPMHAKRWRWTGFLLLLLAMFGRMQAEEDVLRIKIEWLNAQECGIEGCKPQSVVVRSGGSMGFMWRGLPERGAFEIRPLILKEAVEVKVKRTKEPKDDGAAAVTTETFRLQQGEPKEVKIDELRWMLTASKWVRSEKK